MNLAAKITAQFDAAAPSYDAAASMQAQIATQLVDWAAKPEMPHAILDLGSGTGFATEAAAQKYPRAQLTALDAAPAMLRQVQRKLPQIRVVKGDALSTAPEAMYDAVFSSMVLHWLPDPRAVLEQWRGWLKPNGRLYAALLVGGSFGEWRDLCVAQGLQDGLWFFPEAGIFQDIARQKLSVQKIDYPSARDFLLRLKRTGASTPRADHHALGAGSMRTLLASALRPFTVTYRILFLELAARG